MKPIYIVKPTVTLNGCRFVYETYFAKLITIKRKTIIKYIRLNELLSQFPKLDYCCTKDEKEAIFPTKSARNKVSAFIKRNGVSFNEMEDYEKVAFRTFENTIRIQKPKKKFVNIDIHETSEDDGLPF